MPGSELMFFHHEAWDHFEVPYIFGDNLAAMMQGGRPDQHVLEREIDSVARLLSRDLSRQQRDLAFDRKNFDVGDQIVQESLPPYPVGVQFRSLNPVCKFHQGHSR